MTVSSETMDAIDVAMALWSRQVPDYDFTKVAIAIRIIHLALRAQADLQSVARKIGIGAGELDVLFCLQQTHPDHELPPGELSRGCFVTTGTMTGRIDRLEKRGMVVRVPAPTDRRSLLVRLTALGQATAIDLHADLRRNSALILAMEQLSQQDLLELNRRLRHLYLLLERPLAAQPSGEQNESRSTG